MIQMIQHLPQYQRIKMVIYLPCLYCLAQSGIAWGPVVATMVLPDLSHSQKCLTDQDRGGRTEKWKTDLRNGT